METQSLESELISAAELLWHGRLAQAERCLKSFLKRFPTDVYAIRMLAELAGRLGRYEDAETLLCRCLELAPEFLAAKQNYAFVLHKQNKTAEALIILNELLAIDPNDPGMRALKAATLVRVGEYEEAGRLYGDVLREHPTEAKLWMSYGHVLKTLNRGDESVAVYRRSIELSPQLGEAYWSLANLKTFRFETADIIAMDELLGRSTLRSEDRLHLNFALGKALEDQGDYARSFERYRVGNHLRRRQLPYDAEATRSRIDRTLRVFDVEFVARRVGCGNPADDPIFIVGLPRSGSTLIEQILASHSAVEGTMELPDLPALVQLTRGGSRSRQSSDYPECLSDLDVTQLAKLGEEYLRRTRIQRKTGRAHFIDKLPNNFFHVGLIHLILPNARIIDARRHPMATCFSAYKQHFARGQAFSYDLADLGRYYADYVRLMDHMDSVLPGRIYRVHYERLIHDSEQEIRNLLDYCGLEFESACTVFWKSPRPVRTASSEQVRQPIFTDGVNHWRHFERWLGSLEAALGDLVDRYASLVKACRDDSMSSNHRIAQEESL